MKLLLAVLALTGALGSTGLAHAQTSTVAQHTYCTLTNANLGFAISVYGPSGPDNCETFQSGINSGSYDGLTLDMTTQYPTSSASAQCIITNGAVSFNNVTNWEVVFDMGQGYADQYCHNLNQSSTMHIYDLNGNRY